MPRDLGWAWVARREMEIRSRRPPWYETTAYDGLALPLVLVGVPLVLTVPFYGVMSLGWFLFFLLPYASYVAYASANLAAGAVGADLERLRRLPVSPWSFFWGKLAGTTVHIWLEVLMMAPAIVVMSWTCTGTTTPGLRIVAWLFVLSTWTATVGLWHSSAGLVPAAAARDTRTSLDLWVLVVLPLIVIFLYNAPLRLPPGSLCGLWMLHPWAGLGFSDPDWSPSIAYGLTAALVTGGLLAGGSILRLRRLLS